MNLELAAMRWLRFERGCMVVISERSPRQGCNGQPDALGVTKARYQIEVEIKRSMSDFYNDFNKRSRRFRGERLDLAPKEFHYLVPPELAPKVAASNRLPLYAGVLTVTEYNRVYSVKACEVNRQSKKLTIRECVRLAHQLLNYVISVEERYDCICHNFVQGDTSWAPDGVIDFQI